jgi:hypothetical protein
VKEVVEAILALKGSFDGSELIALAALLVVVHYILKPLRDFGKKATSLFQPVAKTVPKSELPVIVGFFRELTEFLSSQIEAKHEEVYAVRGIEKALSKMERHIDRALGSENREEG